MNSSRARTVLGIIVFGFVTLSLVFWSGCANPRPDSAKVTPEDSGPEPALLAVMDLTQDVQSPFKIVSQDNLIPLYPAEPNAYEGHLDLAIQCDSDVPLTASVSAIPPVRVVGDYSCAVSVPAVTAPGGAVTVWVKITRARLRGTPPGSRVATLRLRAVESN